MVAKSTSAGPHNGAGRTPATVARPAAKGTTGTAPGTTTTPAVTGAHTPGTGPSGLMHSTTSTPASAPASNQTASGLGTAPGQTGK